MEKIYLITGAAGHLGTALINELKDTPCKIRALCLVGEKHIPQGENVEIYYGDVCDKDTLCDFFGGLEGKRVLVVHCAGIVSISSKFMQKVYDVNVTGTKNIVDTCMDKGVARLVYVSSVHAIPEKRKKEIISEISDFSPDSVKGLYAKTKAEATAYVLDAARRGLDASVVFPAGIIGPFDYGRSHTNAIISDYVKKRLTAAIRGGYDFVDVRDVAKGIIQCAENGEKGEGYILSGGYYTIREILYMLHEITGQKEIRTFLPVWFVNFFAPLCELYYKVRKKPPLFTKYSISVLSGNSDFSSEKAKKTLGYNPRDMRNTLKDTVKWLAQTGQI